MIKRALLLASFSLLGAIGYVVGTTEEAEACSVCSSKGACQTRSSGGNDDCDDSGGSCVAYGFTC